MAHSLGSRTSGVDGSSEGGRIDTIDMPGALHLEAIPLLQSLQRKNPKARLTVAPVHAGGVWSIEVGYMGDQPGGVPQLWYGRRVILKRNEPPPSA